MELFRNTTLSAQLALDSEEEEIQFKRQLGDFVVDFFAENVKYRKHFDWLIKKHFVTIEYNGIEMWTFITHPSGSIIVECPWSITTKTKSLIVELVNSISLPQIPNDCLQDANNLLKDKLIRNVKLEGESLKFTIVFEDETELKICPSKGDIESWHIYDPDGNLFIAQGSKEFAFFPKEINPKMKRV